MIAALLLATVPSASWQSATAGAARADIGATIWNGRLYVLGGYDASGPVTPIALFTPIAANGAPGNFTSTTGTPFGGGGLGIAGVNGRLYAAGFNSNQFYSTSVNGDGTLNTWGAAAALPYDPYAQGLVASATGLYFAGGVHVTGTSPNFTFTRHNESYLGAVDSGNGSVSWLQGAAVPGARARHGLAVLGTHIWLVGGQLDGGTDGLATNEVLVGTLSGSDVPATWVSTTPLPSSRYSVGSFVSGGFLFAIGGHGDNGASVTADVLQARINPDGTLGAWIHSAPLPEGRYLHGVAEKDGYGYVVFGFTTDYATDILWKKLETPGPAAQTTLAGGQVSATAGSCVGPYTLSLLDAQAKPTWADALTVVTFATTNAEVHDGSACSGAALTQLSIAAGNDAATFYLKPLAAGAAQVVVAPSTFATKTIAVTASAASHGSDDTGGDDPHTVNGWGCTTGGAAGWLALVALGALRRRRAT